MSQQAEQAKKIVGKPYTPSNASALQRIVGTQTIQLLRPGSVRAAAAGTTYVVTDAHETVTAVIVGA